MKIPPILNISACILIVLFYIWAFWRIIKWYKYLDNLINESNGNPVTANIPGLYSNNTIYVTATSQGLLRDTTENYQRMAERTMRNAELQLEEAQRRIEQTNERIQTYSDRILNQGIINSERGINNEAINILMKEAQEKLKKEDVEKLKKDSLPGEDILVL